MFGFGEPVRRFPSGPYSRAFIRCRRGAFFFAIDSGLHSGASIGTPLQQRRQTHDLSCLRGRGGYRKHPRICMRVVARRKKNTFALTSWLRHYHSASRQAILAVLMMMVVVVVVLVLVLVLNTDFCTIPSAIPNRSSQAPEQFTTTACAEELSKRQQLFIRTCCGGQKIIPQI
ncbi:hypothetical protein BZA05DRAFT_24207 [Tricharina praecox]|uniref:uncharacterized protein n=1 Tax=Tricharina praecox TaxID=43433 RepID=UPI00221FFAEF|nr:uncharacterized protein BZA05DRAFT_24207 [Tricharina praecox]KAI5859216.1 hypothetical protein BZA05DRAFT_24207 [Tricharina praecox]